MEEEAVKILDPSRIIQHGCDRIRQLQPDYPIQLDFPTPLVAENLTQCDLKNLARKKRVRGPGKNTTEEQSNKSRKTGLLVGK